MGIGVYTYCFKERDGKSITRGFCAFIDRKICTLGVNDHEDECLRLTVWSVLRSLVLTNAGVWILWLISSSMGIVFAL